MSLSRCVYCNGRHPPSFCNNHKIRKLQRYVGCMGWSECPDFASIPVNELRYIANNYAVYEKIIVDEPPNMVWTAYDRKYGRNPIEITLPKRRLVARLIDRWNGFADFRKNKNNAIKPEYHECPICMDVVAKSMWRDDVGAVRITHYKTKRDACGSCIHPIITRCKHMFCGLCWDSHIVTNARRVGYIHNVWDDTAYVACPMCRKTLLIDIRTPPARTIDSYTRSYD